MDKPDGDEEDKGAGPLPPSQAEAEAEGGHLASLSGSDGGRGAGKLSPSRIKALKKSSSSLKNRAIVLASCSNRQTSASHLAAPLTCYQKISYLLLCRGKKMDVNPKDGYLSAREIYTYENRYVNKLAGQGFQTPKLYVGKKMSRYTNIFKVL